MERKISIIRTHSFVDVITNSSTELFICDTKKELEAIKEILQKIIDGYNMMNDSSYSMDMFDEPYVFFVDEYRKWRKEDKKNENECRKNNDFSKRDCDNKFNTLKGWFNDDENKEDLKNLRIEYIENGDNSGGCWGSDKNPFYVRLKEAVNKNGKYNYKEQRNEVEKIYKEIQKNKDKPNWWEEPWKYNYNNALVKELDGCVILCGSGDNSVPYDIWNVINSKLNARNYHLG